MNGSNKATVKWLMAWSVVTIPCLISRPHSILAQVPVPSISISEFQPKSELVVPQTRLTAAKFPVIDVHTHFRFKTKGDPQVLENYLAIMDRNRIAINVSLDAALGSEDEHFAFLKSSIERFGVFAHIDFRGQGELERPETWACNQPGFVHLTVEQIRAAHRRGILGLKFFKQFGLEYRDARGQLWSIDDHQFDPIWEVCGELQMPVLIHTADPVAFFRPMTPQNERAEELLRHPDWSFFGKDYPGHDELLEARNRVIKRFPQTKFIGAHVGNHPEDLSHVSKMLDEMPNLYVDIASRIGELGRQPVTAKRFFEKYADRILFGTDGPWPEQRLFSYWRFLETSDEYFPYSELETPPQGLWNIYGLDLNDRILQRIYFQNALELIPQLKEKYDVQAARLIR